MERKKVSYFDALPFEPSVLREPEATYMVGKVREGLPLAEFYLIQQMLGITEERLGAMVGLSRATLHRRKKAGRLEMAESDRLVRYARLVSHASEALGGMDSARSWLLAPALAFQGETPLEYSDTEAGAREVEALLGRLEHGVFS